MVLDYYFDVNKSKNAQFNVLKERTCVSGIEVNEHVEVFFLLNCSLTISLKLWMYTVRQFGTIFIHLNLWPLTILDETKAKLILNTRTYTLNTLPSRVVVLWVDSFGIFLRNFLNSR